MKLDDLIRDAKKDSPKDNFGVDWKSVDEKLFARIEEEPKPLPSEDEGSSSGGRVVWIGSAIALAAAAAALVLVHPASSGVDPHAQAPQNAGVVAAGDVEGHVAGAQLARGDRIDVVDQVAYFDAPGKVRWAAPRGSLLHVEHAASPLVLSLEKGAAEAQVTPVPNGEAFAIDVTSSSGEVVRVAVHGTHLRVARDGDKVTVDLTEGVVSIGAPPRRGSTIGQLVTAPAHVELDARDLSSVRVDHTPSAVRPAESVMPAPRADQETAFVPPATIQQQTQTLQPFDVLGQSQHTQTLKAPTTLGNVAPTAWLTTPDEVAAAIAACGKDQVATGITFSTNLALELKDDGTPSMAHFNPPFMPGATGDSARDCATNVIYKRTKLSNSGSSVTVPVEIK